MTYFWLLLLHGALRWFILLVGVSAILRAWQGSRQGFWTRLDERLTTLFISLLDAQLLLGLILYAISPIRTAAYADPGSSLDNEMGFFAFLHPALMIVAIALAHIGKALAKRPLTPAQKQERLLSFFLPVLILMAMAIPWWRPFLRF